MTLEIADPLQAIDPQANISRQCELARALLSREPIEWRSRDDATVELAELVLALHDAGFQQ